jgi:signal transduction histidine kinase
MRERAAALGGTIETGMSAQGGFRVTATLPLERAT